MQNKKIISDWYDHYSDDLYNFLLYRVGEADVEDLLQEVFIRAYKGLGSFEGDANPKTWLYNIARNISIDEIRKRQRQKWKSIIPFESNHEPKTERTPEQVLELDEEKQVIYQAIQSLKPAFRDVIILRGIKELSVTETADVLNWTENKVRSTYHRSKQSLAQKIGGDPREQ
ncbi:RNA polymerase sigma factor [Alkalibacillus haloalkaliphilus]|uniref:RNA polymerase sigma factor n=1 Tax=Alkalibacillus haloalkaliphilus TaxID=94136 RepID=UPI002936D237|nr:sigma-70 family RNA polymerase sigma factor [Alkalibacillus haloalkaliphilus]MDV2581555.1 sigma-70 family RNA polymerase sigma factor [Alkalibacillus haloalkaliphilus]